MKKICILLFMVIIAIAATGCSPSRHHGHIYIHDPNHIEAVFDRPMSMSVERDGVKVEASSIQPGLLEDIIKFMLLRPK